ncbi:MAG: peptidase family protein [Friedmanniella sp.]|nr:peptidase family protein [Friedmanniella sp.]
MPRSRLVAPVLVALLVVGVVTGLVTGALGSAARSSLYATGLWSRNGPSTISPGLLDSPASAQSGPSGTPVPDPSAAGGTLPVPVLAPAVEPGGLDPAQVRRVVSGVTVAGATGTYGAAVRDLTSGRLLYGHDPGRGLIPASTMKVLTTTAALSLLGPEHRFATSVVRGGAGRIVLVGGGDPYLATTTSAATFPARASVTDLAARTATALRASGTTSIKLGYDASLFTGPAWNAAWPASYGDVVTPVSALWVDEGRRGGHQIGPRTTDPSRDAAQAFAAALRKRGVKVGSVAPARASRTATPVAAVQSMPLERIVAQVLLTSDNDAAEVLFRQAALAGGGAGSFTDGVRVVTRELRTLGVWGNGMRLSDGSGLARRTRVSADSLTRALRLAAVDGHPELRGVVHGLPVAGVEGSLRVRFFDDASAAGRGVVRGKTGTLTKVHSLAGLLRSRDGSVLVFAFVINEPRNDYAATVWLDRVTTALTGCGCR